MSRYRIGVDVGGTFTDLVLADAGSGALYTGKLLTTPRDPAVAIIDGIRQLLDAANLAPECIAGLVHGTTLVTNTVIERKGAKVGLITTAGFRDAIEMGREIRYDLYDLFLEPAPTLVPRRRRLGVGGRMSADGEELEPLDLAAVREAARALRDEHAVEAIAVCFIHAYRNPAHELAAAKVLAEECPGLPVTLSCEVAPEIREFERASTACVNAYVQPLMQGYLRDLEVRLADMYIDAPLHVMLSGGGIATVAQASAFPVRLIESGPAAGALAACYYGRKLGEPDLLSFDMGGTTAKICLVEGGQPNRTHEFEAGRVRRFRKGSGIPLKITVVDMIEIGAGGGSLAHADSMGLLKVGPQSAGSEPGPVCYGRGGEGPAVTDADLMLGCLNPGYFLGGEMDLATDAVTARMQAVVGEPLELSDDAVARGIHDVVNENMAAATRRYLAEKGRDPRRYTMIAFGGAGPVHAYGLARKLKINRFVVPPGAGVTSALGFLVAPPAIDDVRSYVVRLDALDPNEANRLFADMEQAAAAQLVEAGASAESVHFTRSADMRYVGQGFEIQVPVRDGAFDKSSRADLHEQFMITYEALFHRSVTEVPVEVLSWRLYASAPPPAVDVNFAATMPASTRAPTSRRLTLPEVGTVEAAVFDRYALTPGDRFDGPLIVEERESTTVVGPDATLSVDAELNLIVDLHQMNQP
ncbi:MAG: hydantoinase/oxoprolinase family protein [Pseudomonadota bacterium]